MTPPWGLYVHVPWCRIRCPYCAFHVDPDRGDLPAYRFVDRVLADVAALRVDYEGTPHTVYLGGGTPSRLPAPALARLLDGLVAPETVEVTCEANPEDVDEAWLEAAVGAGVTRVSLGVQTLDPTDARHLGRAHTPAHAQRAAALVADAVPTWSADLMFALPDQELADLERDLEALLELGPPHVSLYGLTLEEGTPFARAAAAGRLATPEDETWRAMYAHLVDRLGAAGLVRYEVSNFARPGHEAVHNAGYWALRPYLGVGPSAHGLTPDGRRATMVSDTAAWLAADRPPVTWEHPQGDEAAADALVAGLRGSAGVDLDLLARTTGHRPRPEAVARLVAGGLLEVVDGRTRLAAEGFFVADAVTGALVQALAPVAPARSTR
ncbi:MAG: coproporphyrinogen III oxidase family protein [Alphaproteobacteria bacterium]|nr:coproporphyrinogen III oxidase family protein [Alphaproteobacteria bacterium]